VRDNLRWNHYIQRLRAEPGIAVTEAHRHWFGYAVTGLRDPYAVEPRELLSSFKIPVRKVTEKWQPFLSLDPKFTVARKLESDKQALEKQVLRFEVNATQLRPDQFALLDSVADEILSLESAAGLNGQHLSVEVGGHTDDTGQEERNAQLSQARADTVVRALEKKGIPAGLLVARGLGTPRAQYSGEEEYPKELDRRVTFKIIGSGTVEQK
jgi:outer membrane protein OmpA-like peptidoglycan-associated protein